MLNYGKFTIVNSHDRRLYIKIMSTLCRYEIMAEFSYVHTEPLKLVASESSLKYQTFQVEQRK